MNQLEFSPISQKQQQSIDAYSFLHNPGSHQRRKSAFQAQQGTFKIFDKLDRMLHNRQSYSFQLLKQFILFSSDQETIEIHYKYTQYQLEQGVEYLENSYGLNVKLTLVKAFQDIRNFANKRKVYENRMHVTQFTNVFDNFFKEKEHIALKLSFKILRKFIEQSKDTGKNKTKQIAIQKLNEPKVSQFRQELGETPEQQSKQYPYTFQINSKQQIQNAVGMNRKSSVQPVILQPLSHLRQKRNRRNQWKYEGQELNSYEMQPITEIPHFKNSRVLTKSMSHQLPGHQILDYSRQKNTTVLKGELKLSSAHNTPSRRNQNYDVFETKRRRQQSAQLYKRQPLDDNGVQNVIIIRSSKKQKREPDRYIRVPIKSEQVKIIELIPDQKEKGRKKNVEVQLQKNLQTISSRNNSNSSNNRASQKQRQLLKDRQFYLQSGNARKSKKYIQQIVPENSELHECLGCKYCQVIKQMQKYRIQRANTQRINLF